MTPMTDNEDAADSRYDDDDDDDGICPECHGDGRDRWSDYFLPYPLCQGEQRP